MKTLIQQLQSRISLRKASIRELEDLITFAKAEESPLKGLRDLRNLVVKDQVLDKKIYQELLWIEQCNKDAFFDIESVPSSFFFW